MLQVYLNKKKEDLKKIFGNGDFVSKFQCWKVKDTRVTIDYISEKLVEEAYFSFTLITHYRILYQNIRVIAKFHEKFGYNDVVIQRIYQVYMLTSESTNTVDKYWGQHLSFKVIFYK